MTVTRNTIIAEILQNDPSQGCVPIFLNTGMHCLGCMAAHGETVEQACMVHGVDVDDLLQQVNAMIAAETELLKKRGGAIRPAFLFIKQQGRKQR